METVISLAIQSIEQVWLTLQHNWPFLVVSVIIAAALKLYINAEKVSAFLQRYRGAGVVAATTAAVATPLCSCGTTAVVLGMLASTMPWAPIVAFMVASPLTSPGELVFSAGLFGWPFALAFFLSSILLGLAGGWIAEVFEKRGWLANQTRFNTLAPAACSCSAGEVQPVAPGKVYSQEISNLILVDQVSDYACEPAASPCGCGQAAPAPTQKQAALFSGAGLAGFLKETINSAARLLTMFVGFAFIGYFLNGLIPASWVTAIFGSGNAYSVPLAATLSLPLYINTEASLPLIRALLEAGMSQGAALAFLIAGSGTSIGAIAGALTIARWRVIALVVGVLWIGAIASGYAYDLVLALHWL